MRLKDVRAAHELCSFTIHAHKLGKSDEKKLPGFSCEAICIVEQSVGEKLCLAEKAGSDVAMG